MSRRKQRKQRSGAPARPAHIRPSPGPRPASFYASPIDAVVLAGTDGNPKRLVAGRNKAFLDFGGLPLVRRVVESLLEAASVDRIFVVGPVDALDEALRGLPPRVRMVQQVGRMVRNAWAGVEASERLRGGPDGPQADRPVLFLSADLPLASAEAMDDFVARCAGEDAQGAGPHALMVGVAEEASVLPFYPRDGLPGIVRPFVELRSGRYRLANIYVARPHRMAHREMLQAGFSHRKAKEWRQVLGLARTFFRRRGGWRAVSLILRLQASVLVAKHKGRIYRALRRRNTVEQLESSASLLLGGSLRLVSTPFGGLSLDVDDEEDYLILGQRFAEWSAQSHARSGAQPA